MSRAARADGRIADWLPPRALIDLVVRTSAGRCEAELGRLWLRTGGLESNMGGIVLAFSSPLHEPIWSLRLKVEQKMGQVNIRR